MHSGQIALEIEPLVAGIAFHCEHFGQRDFAVAVKDLEPFDLGQRLVTGPVGSESFDLNGNGRDAVIGK